MLTARDDFDVAVARPSAIFTAFLGLGSSPLPSPPHTRPALVNGRSSMKLPNSDASCVIADSILDPFHSFASL